MASVTYDVREEGRKKRMSIQQISAYECAAFAGRYLTREALCWFSLVKVVVEVVVYDSFVFSN